MYKVAFDTFGCRLNQAETATLHDRFRARGYESTDDVGEADLFVINTCTLTMQAGAKCRRRIRSVIRRNPDACIAAVGCHAQTDAEMLARIRGVDYIVGTADKLRLAELIPSPAKLPEPLVVRNAVARGVFTIEGTGRYPGTTRANLKVQEGCDFACSFCIIPRSRGRARSRAYSDILREALALAQAGHREIVITGVNMGTWRDGPRTFADVARALCDVDGLDRVRLSSIEPTTIERAVVREMARPGSKLCPYLHVPIQSGDDAVLARMRRKYTSAEFRGFLEDALARVPDLGLGTDVMVGFPGEDADAFARSAALVAELPFTNVHVFSFSTRPRTSAHQMRERVEPAIVRQRSERLHRLAEARQAESYAAYQGRTLRVLFEQRLSDGSYVGFTDNYIRVSVHTPRELANQLARVRIMGVRPASGELPFAAVGELVV
jgi:threonylcarbamoyladenosine tRNA methylthiotransferase MtaB